MTSSQTNYTYESFSKYYSVAEDLGSGQFAKVRKCLHKVSGKEYAAKFIKKRKFNASRRGAKRSDIDREVQILREIGGHDNVISLYEVFETEAEVILVLELVSGGELFEHVCKKERLSEEEAAAFIRQILAGVRHLHARNVVHLDIKPENVMLLNRSCTQVKLIDFGLSRKILPGHKVQDMIGTPEFVAPEIVNYECLTTATDMWAVGVVTYILLSGTSPFLGDDRAVTFTNISLVKYDFDEEYFTDTSELAKDFVRRLFIKDIRKRATVEQCLQHPWIKPQIIEDLALIRESVVKLNSLKSLHIRKRWRNAIIAVQTCNRLCYNAKMRATHRAMQQCNGNNEEKCSNNEDCGRYDPVGVPPDVVKHCLEELLLLCCGDKNGLKQKRNFSLADSEAIDSGSNAVDISADEAPALISNNFDCFEEAPDDAELFQESEDINNAIILRDFHDVISTAVAEEFIQVSVTGTFYLTNRHNRRRQPSSALLKHNNDSDSSDKEQAGEEMVFLKKEQHVEKCTVSVYETFSALETSLSTRTKKISTFRRRCSQTIARLKPGPSTSVLDLICFAGFFWLVITYFWNSLPLNFMLT